MAAISDAGEGAPKGKGSQGEGKSPTGAPHPRLWAAAKGSRAANGAIRGPSKAAPARSAAGRAPHPRLASSGHSHVPGLAHGSAARGSEVPHRKAGTGARGGGRIYARRTPEAKIQVPRGAVASRRGRGVPTCAKTRVFFSKRLGKRSAHPGRPQLLQEVEQGTPTAGSPRRRRRRRGGRRGARSNAGSPAGRGAQRSSASAPRAGGREGRREGRPAACSHAPSPLAASLPPPLQPPSSWAGFLESKPVAFNGTDPRACAIASRFPLQTPIASPPPLLDKILPFHVCALPHVRQSRERRELGSR